MNKILEDATKVFVDANRFSAGRNRFFRRALVLGSLLLLVPCILPLMPHARAAQTESKSATMKETEDTFRALAAKMRSFSISNVIYDRFQSYGKPAYSGENAQDYAEITSPRHSTASLIKLLKDGDPKVRTLAIAGLCAREDPSVLPYLVELADDKAKTFPQPMPVAMAVSSAASMPLEDITVGYVAQAVVRGYMEAGGFHYGIKGSGSGPGSEPGFSKYWEEHKNRKYSAGWFEMRLARASTGCTPTDKTRIGRIKEVRAAIDKVPVGDRQWTLLWLRSCSGADALAGEGELVAAMKELGPDKLLLMLQNKIPSQDPDLQPRRSNCYQYHDMQLTVLKHARQVLRPDQSSALLDCAMWERDYQKNHRSDPLISPWWGIAAAELAPKKARQILHDEFNRLDADYYGYQKAELGYALFCQCGLSESKFLTDCFYDPNSLMKNKLYSNYRPQWLKSMGDASGPSKTQRLTMLRNITADARFTGLNDASALRAMAEAITKLTGSPALTTEQLEKAWHPMGLDAVCCNIDAGRKQFPKETQQLLDVLSQWRASITQSLNKRP